MTNDLNVAEEEYISDSIDESSTEDDSDNVSINKNILEQG